MTDKKNWGGLRNPPGGRPTNEARGLPPKKARISVTIDPDLRDWLKTQRQHEKEPLSQVVERLLWQIRAEND